MKSNIATLLIALLVLHAQPSRAGLLVTDVSGSVSIAGQGKVTTLAEIPDGVQLILATGARLVAVDLASGREYVLAGGSQYRVGANGPTTAAGKPVEAMALPVKNLPAVRIAIDKVAPATLVMRGMRPANVPVPLSPVRTAILTDQPIFNWSGVDAAESYVLTVIRQDGSVLWRMATRETELPLPREFRLTPGERYTWRVEAKGEAGRLADASAGFTVAAAETIQRLRQLRTERAAPFGRRVLYAAQLSEAGVLEEAAELWRVLAIERPEDEILKARGVGDGQ
jgi:hypothetical protein